MKVLKAFNLPDCVQASSGPAFDVKMTKLGFLRLSYEKQDTLLKLLILSMAAVLCKSVPLGMAPGAEKPRVTRELCVFTLSSLCLQLSPQDFFLS